MSICVTIHIIQTLQKNLKIYVLVDNGITCDRSRLRRVRMPINKLEEDTIQQLQSIVITHFANGAYFRVTGNTTKILSIVEKNRYEIFGDTVKQIKTPGLSELNFQVA